MKILQTMVFLFASLGLFALDAQAQNVRRSALTGELVSASATIQGEQTTATLYVVPGGRTFVLTQVCSTYGGMPGPRLVGSQLGSVPMGGDYTTPCISYAPGVRFEGGETISCEFEYSPELGTACLITGVLQ